MNTTIATLAKKALYLGGYYHIYRNLERRREPRLLVLTYHDILTEARAHDPAEIDSESPTGSQFEAHVNTIVRHYPLVSLRDSIETLLSGELKEDCVAITFDDGCEAVYTVAYPVLKKFGAPATVFLLTGWIDGEKPFWWHRVRDAVKRATFAGVGRAELERVLEVPCEGFGETVVDLRARRWLDRSVQAVFREMNDEEREERVRRLEGLLFPDGDSNPVPEQPLTWEQIQRMSADGIEFGVHTRSHITIRFSDRETIERDIADSKATVEKQTGQQVVGFAYPYGKDVASYWAAGDTLRKHGFRYACTTRFGANTSQTDPYLLKRASLPLTMSSALLHRDLILQFAREDRGEEQAAALLYSQR